jgi:tetratricopeptide (TPR) repeat protein
MNSLKHFLTSTAIAFFLQPTFMQESALAMDGWNADSGWGEDSNNGTLKKPQKAGATELSWEKDIVAAEEAHWGGNSEEALKCFLGALIKSPYASGVWIDTTNFKTNESRRVSAKTLSPESVDSLLCHKDITFSVNKELDIFRICKVTLDGFLVAFHKSPTSPFDCYWNGVLNSYEARVAYYEEALKKFPDSYNLYIKAGNCAENFKKHQEALQYYVDALKKFPDSHDLYIKAGDSARCLEEYEEALQYYSMAFQKNPDSPWIHYYIAGVTAARLKKHEATCDYLDIYLKKASKICWTDYNQIGKAAHALGKDAEALDYFQKALEAHFVQKREAIIGAQKALEKRNRAIKLQQIAAQKAQQFLAFERSLETTVAQEIQDPEKVDIKVQQSLETNVAQEIPDPEKVDIEFLKLKIDLLQDPAAKEKFFQEWIHFFEHNPDKEETLLRANMIINYYEEIGLFEEHPFVQAAIRAGLLAETSDDPLNPYNFHKNLLKKREQQIDWSQINPVKETVNGYEIQLTPEFFQKQVIEFVPFKALPPYNPSLLKNMIGILNEKVANNPKINQYIQEVTGLSYEQLKEESIIKGKLYSRLAYKGDLEEAVPLTQIRLIALMDFITSLSNELETQDSLLSKQEESLIRSLAAIQGCSTGVEEGIQAAYLYHVPVPKKTLTKNQEEDLRDIVSAMLPVIEKQFSGNNHFAKKVIGMNPREEVQQASHNGRCLRNLIGDKVGLQGIKFDTGTQVLYKEIVEKTSQEVVQVFYQYLLPTEIVTAVGQRAILEDEGDTIELLEKMGVMKILSRPQ